MFGFNRVEREIYNSTFLRKVFINIKFPLVEQLKEKFKNINDLFINEFPRTALGKNKGFQISIGNNDNNPNFKSIDEKDSLSLKSENGQTELLINYDNISFSIEGKTYKCFEEHIQTVLDKIIILFDILGVNQVLSCNLHKINLIEFGYGENNIPNGILEALLNKAIVYNDDAFPNVGNINQNIHNVEFKEGEYSLNLKYGMNTLPFADKKVGQLIVDYNIQSNVSLDVNLVSTEIKLINDELFNVFSWIFNEDAKQILKNEIIK